MLGVPCARPADRLTQGLPAGSEAALQGQADGPSRMESIFLDRRTTLGSDRRLHGGADVENHHGEYNRRKDARKKRGGQEIFDKPETIPVKPDTSSDGDTSVGDDKRYKRKNKKKRNQSKKSRKNRAYDTSSIDWSSSYLKASDDEKRKRPSQRKRRG